MIQQIFNYFNLARLAESLPFIGFMIVSHSLKQGVETLSQQNQEMSLDGVVDIFFSNLEAGFSGVYEKIANKTGRIMKHYERARQKLLKGLEQKITAKEYFAR